MRLQFVTIGQNVNWPRGRLSLARKKKHEEITLNYCMTIDESEAHLRIFHNSDFRAKV